MQSLSERCMHYDQNLVQWYDFFKKKCIMVVIYDATVSFSDGVRQQDKNKTNKKTMQNANSKMLLTI